ncbi:MAG: methyltransferase [Steroidobacteraceae bacterium]
MDRNKALGALINLQMGFLKSACLYVVAKLEVADQLANGERSSDEIARKAKAHPEYLYRVMRLLASEGVFEEKAGRVFALTPMAELLRVDTEGSFQPFIVFNSETAFEAVLGLLDGVVAGHVPFEKRFGRHVFAWMQEHPERVAHMERAWQGIHWPETAAVLNGYDFSRIGRLADVGGGHGDVLIGYLAGGAQRSGVLFDAPQVAAQVSKRISDLGLSKRCDVVGGDFFKEIPVRADAYFLRHILHDWDDAECVRILRNIAAVAQPGNRVLIAECLVKGPNISDTGKLFDIEMMLFLTGRERTVDEYRKLLEAAGFQYSGVTATNSIVSVVEGIYPG